MGTTKRFATLICGFVLLGAAATARASEESGLKVIATHGQWKTFSTSQAGELVSGVMTVTSDSEISIYLSNHGVVMFLRRNGWSLPVRATTRVSLSIGRDSTVEQVATVLSPDQIAIPVTDDQFVNQLLWSLSATAVVEGVPLQIDLHGYSDALHDAFDKRQKGSQ